MADRKTRIINSARNYFESRRGGKMIPYRIGSFLIRWFCRTTYAHNVYFFRRVRIIKEFLQETKIQENNPEVIRKMLTFIFLRKWRYMAISYLSDKKLKKYIRIQNLDAFKEIYNQGKGVIVVSSHYGLTESALSLFPKIGFKDFYTVVRSTLAGTEKFSDINPKIPVRTLHFDGTDAGYIKLLMEAKHTLNEGGIVHLLGDGFAGKSSVNLPFLGKIRGFRGSYAELALSTEASIVPMFITVTDNYKVILDLRHPLDKGSEDQSREEKTIHIVKQFAEQLTEAWTKEPQFLNIGLIEEYFQLVENNAQLNVAL